MEETKNSRETKAKTEAKTVERARSWDKAKEKEKAEIEIVNAEARESLGAEDKVRLKEKTNTVQRAAMEAAANIRAKVEAKRGERGKAEAEAR